MQALAAKRFAFCILVIGAAGEALADPKAAKPSTAPAPSPKITEASGVITSGEWGDLPHCYLEQDKGAGTLDLYADPEECQKFKGKRVRVTYSKDKLFVEGAGGNVEILRVSTMKPL